MVFSTSDANITFSGAVDPTTGAHVTTGGGVTTITLPKCDIAKGNQTYAFTVTVVDLHGNAMPAGTTIGFASDNGTFSGLTSFVVPDTIGCRSSYLGCPASPPATVGSPTFGDLGVTMKSDATYTPGDPNANPPTQPACVDRTPSGTFTVTVKTNGVTSGTTTFVGTTTTATAGVIEQ
jgi:hypothetical protein